MVQGSPQLYVAWSEGLGRPILYATTPEFMQHLGLGSMSELPPVEAAEAEASHDELLKG